MQWNEEQRKIIARYNPKKDWTKQIPEDKIRRKCFSCYSIFTPASAKDPKCPNCGEVETQIMCELDHCHCSEDVIETIDYCPICNAPICPKCGSHDVSQIYRVTGYLADIKGMNEGKQQEIKDRQRYDIATGVK